MMKRLLFCYDWSYMPASIGDFILTLRSAMCEQSRLGLSNIDFCSVFDYNEISKKKFKEPSYEIERRYLKYRKLFLLCDNIIDDYKFQDRKEYYGFLKKNRSKYVLFPSLLRQLSMDWSTIYHSDITFKFLRKFGGIPRLNYPIESQDKTDKVTDKPLIVMNLRNNPIPSKRNADMDVWYEFLKLANEKYNDTFYIIGEKHEKDYAMACLENVKFTKDMGFCLVEDMALLDNADLFISTETGVALVYQYLRKPYLLYCEKRARRFYKYDNPTKLQVRVYHKPSTQEIVKRFERLMRDIK